MPAAERDVLGDAAIVNAAPTGERVGQDPIKFLALVRQLVRALRRPHDPDEYTESRNSNK
jgi:hypothetical protein